MFQTYAHLAGTDIDEAILKNYGVKALNGDTPTGLRLEPRQCEHCYVVNAPTSNFCSGCGRPLDPLTAMKLDEKIQMARDSPDYKQLMTRLKKELNLQFFLLEPY